MQHIVGGYTLEQRQLIQFLCGFTFAQLEIICRLFDISLETFDAAFCVPVEMILEEDITIPEIKRKIDESRKYKFIILCGNQKHTKDLKCGCKVTSKSLACYSSSKSSRMSKTPQSLSFSSLLFYQGPLGP